MKCLPWCAGMVLLAASGSAQTARPGAPAVPPGPDRATTLKRAATALGAGNRVEAAQLLRSAADRFRSVSALLQLARLQKEDKDMAGALRSLDRARTLAPNSEEVLSAHAELSLATDAPLAAVLDLEPLTRMCPLVAQYHYLLGEALLQIGDPATAVPALRRAQELEPNRALLALALGRGLNARALYGEARPHLLRSLELEPESAEAAAALAESLLGLGETGEAETQAQRALVKAPESASATLVLGLLRLRQERYPEARAALEKAVTASPTSARAHLALSEVYTHLSDEASARRHRELQRRSLEDTEKRVQQLRDRTGMTDGVTEP